MDKRDFGTRVAELRMRKGVSAREMSSFLGQCQSYITNIENGKHLPSMTSFFAICDYLSITPLEFFTTEDHAPDKTKELLIEARRLHPESLDHLLALVKIMK